MSVLVEGMEMPKSCDECPLLTEDGDYDVCFVGKRCVMWEWKHDRGLKVIHPKPDWCPLVRVPPHSDLIDRDKLREKEFIHDGDAYAVVMSRDIRNAPTIIPADKDGDNNG